MVPPFTFFEQSPNLPPPEVVDYGYAPSEEKPVELWAIESFGGMAGALSTSKASNALVEQGFLEDKFFTARNFTQEAEEKKFFEKRVEDAKVEAYEAAMNVWENADTPEKIRARLEKERLAEEAKA